ncbi:MAG: hypothetical protein JNL67_15985 [Planctomycetaceae bacterium]|nr:hypothetical protein [Planctomycetaceae bacterium]
MKFQWFQWTKRGGCLALLGTLMAGFSLSTLANDDAAQRKLEFDKPVLVMAGGEPVSVESPGYACPTIVDLDKDGRLDLVVGQFNQGAMQFFKNTAEPGQTPTFEKGEWLMSEGSRATVPGVW